MEVPFLDFLDNELALRRNLIARGGFKRRATIDGVNAAELSDRELFNLAGVDLAGCLGSFENADGYDENGKRVAYVLQAIMGLADEPTERQKSFFAPEELDRRAETAKELAGRLVGRLISGFDLPYEIVHEPSPVVEKDTMSKTISVRPNPPIIPLPPGVANG